MPVYTEEKFIDQIIIEPEFGTVLWRESTKIFRDGVEISKTYHRGSAMLDEDRQDIPAEVVPHRTLIDTPERRQKLADEKNKNKAK